MAGADCVKPQGSPRAVARYSPLVPQSRGEADKRFEGWSAKADIGYWKIDIDDPSFRLTALHDQKRLPLTLEHIHGEAPVNGDWRKDSRFGLQPWGSRRLDILAHTDVYRTYDVTSILSLSTTLDRVAEMLKGAEGHSEISSLLNVEDEVPFSPGSGTVKVNEDVLTAGASSVGRHRRTTSSERPSNRVHPHASHEILAFLPCKAWGRNPSSLLHVFPMEL